MQASILATLVLLLGVVGCGSSSTQAEKRARIEAALRHFEQELQAGQREARDPRALRRKFGGADVLGALTLVYAPAPRGVSQGEWDAAIKHDKRLHRLVEDARAPVAGGPTMIELSTPAAVARAGGHELREYQAGKRAVAQSGCLACHRIGKTGNPGPGPDLTDVAARLPRQAIARTLIAPTEPMPSFKNLPPAKFDAIVTFLAQLK
jgi:mono/diheme cytochrome c family protein